MSGRQRERRIRLAVLDDGLFVRTLDGDFHPAAATFHRFVEAVVRAGPFDRARYLAPVRQLAPGAPPPVLASVDRQLLEMVPTSPFTGIADYVLRLPYLALRNWRPISAAIGRSDLLWLRLPASNALLAVAACRRARVPRFNWVAGSAGRVAAGQRRPLPLRWLARVVAAGYDAATDVAARGGPTIVLDGEMFSSVVSAAEVTASRAAELAAGPARRIVWSGRMGREKGLIELLAAVGQLVAGGRDVELLLVGDGPARRAVEAAAQQLPPGTVHFAGYVGDRLAYMQLLRSGDLFVSASHAEGAPKVLVEAMAAGLPIAATEVGASASLLGDGERGVLVRPADPAALARAIGRLIDDASLRARLRDSGLAWAAEHTDEAQARRLLAWLAERFPALPWSDGSPAGGG